MREAKHTARLAAIAYRERRTAVLTRISSYVIAVVLTLFVVLPFAGFLPR